MSWKGELLHDIHDNLSPNEFEKFVYNLLENIGFSELELLGQSGDGGIDLKACARALGKARGLCLLHVLDDLSRSHGVRAHANGTI